MLSEAKHPCAKRYRPKVDPGQIVGERPRLDVCKQSRKLRLRRRRFAHGPFAPLRVTGTGVLLVGGVNVGKPTVSNLNALNTVDAVALLGGIFEHSPWIVEAAWSRRPFASVEALHAACCEVIRDATTEQQLALIRAHPDLVGRAAQARTLTRESTGEQRAAGLGPDDLTPDDVAAFTRFNAAYQERFGFPFVICARENKKSSILTGFERRLGNDPKTERATALGEIERIGWYRLLDLVENDPAQ